MGPLKDRPGFDDWKVPLSAPFLSLDAFRDCKGMYVAMFAVLSSMELDKEERDILLGGNCEAEEERQERLFTASRKKAPWKNTQLRINDYSPCL